jgi:hypothetical protein
VCSIAVLLFDVSQKKARRVLASFRETLFESDLTFGRSAPKGGVRRKCYYPPLWLDE